MEKKVLEISLSSMIRQCSLNRQLVNIHYKNIGLGNREIIHDTFRYKKYEDDLVERVDVFCDENHFMGMIRPSYDYFLESIIKSLNEDIDIIQDGEEEITKKLNERVERLKTIKKEDELKNEFPLLYRDLVNGRKSFRQILKLKRENEAKFREEEHYFYSCAMKRSLSKFIETQSEMYTRYVNKRHLLKEKMENTNFNAYIRNNFDMNKLAMFLTHEYLKVCEISNDNSQIREYLKKVEMYLNNNKYDKSVVIYSDNNERIDINIIMSRLTAIKERINNSSKVNWILIPRGREYRYARKNSNVRVKRTLMNNDELNNLQEVGKSKNDFYESTNYVAKVVGLGKYKGYVVYIYNNGKVVLDMEYDPNRPTVTAIGNAAYIVSVCDFERLSRLTKRELQKNPSVKKICHTKKWQENIDKEIKQEATEADEHNTKSLIKRLKRKALY